MTNATLRHGGWEKWHDWQAGVMTPVTDWLCATATERRLASVLDAACGTGLPALALAERLRSDGRVVAIDLSPTMVAAVQRKAAAAGLANLEARAMDLAKLDFADASFGAVTCKDGLMYCPSPVDGARELHRVLEPGGRVAVTAWDEPAQCPFFRTLFETVTRFAPPPAPAPAPRGPGPFRLSRPGDLEETLRTAGFVDVVVERREVVFTFDSLEMHWDVVRDMAAPVEAAAAALPAPALAALRSALADALAPYTSPSDGRLRVPSVALCASGRRA